MAEVTDNQEQSPQEQGQQGGEPTGGDAEPAWLAKRLEAARSKAAREAETAAHEAWLKKLGVATAEEADAKLKALADAEEARKTEDQKRAEAFDKAVAENQALAAKNAELAAKLADHARRDRWREAWMAAGYRPDRAAEALTLAGGELDPEADEKEFEAAVKAAAERYPELASATPTRPSSRGQETPPATPRRPAQDLFEKWNMLTGVRVEVQ